MDTYAKMINIKSVFMKKKRVISHALYDVTYNTTI